MDTTTLQTVNLTASVPAPSAIPAVKRKRWIWPALLSVALLFSTVILAFHAYIAWNLARPHIDPLTSNPMKAANLPYENVSFPSITGGEPLQGWYIPGSSKQTVVFSHGYGGNREEIWVPIYELAHELHRQNYNVLMFDYGYVQPASKRIMSGGLQESNELLGAVEYIKQKKGADKIFIWGFSMGAGTSLQAALRSDKIDGMILDSTFLLEPDTLYHNMKQVVDLPKYPSLPLVRVFFPFLNGVSLQQVPYLKVKENNYSMPIFFIHGEKDLRALMRSLRTSPPTRSRIPIIYGFCLTTATKRFIKPIEKNICKKQ